ncbi:hypothetical protein R3P38DRAFT_2867747 [Favolaschia claudopus]|uniref:Homeobox domain-containing protein n=1 Tax=Favolaschia claudopus TaxID=2862362 RepID=A0AAW0DA34_9AGAR
MATGGNATSNTAPPAPTPAPAPSYYRPADYQPPNQQNVDSGPPAPAPAITSYYRSPNDRPPPSPVPTLASAIVSYGHFLGPVHHQELQSIWPADPRIPSLRSRKAWALARNVEPAYVHNWFRRRRLKAKQLNVTIPEDTYELPVRNPLQVLFTIKPEPLDDVTPLFADETAAEQSNTKGNVQVDLETKNLVKAEPEPMEPELPSKKANRYQSARRRRRRLNPKARLTPPRRRAKKAHNEVDAGEKASESTVDAEDVASPTKSSKKKTKKANNEVDASEKASETTKDSKRKRKTPASSTVDAEDVAPLTKPSKKKAKKADNEVDASGKASESTVDAEDVAPPTKSSKKKAKKANNEIDASEKASETTKDSKRKRKRSASSLPQVDSQPMSSTSSTTVELETAARPRKKRKTVRFDLDLPPSSSPTLRASSPPLSDAPTLLGDSSPSPLAESTKRSRKKAKRTVGDDKETVDYSFKENLTPAKVAKKAATRRKRKVKKPQQENGFFVCDQADSTSPTGFTCALCASAQGDNPTTDEAADKVDTTPAEPNDTFDWHFSFSTSPGPFGDYTNICVDLTPLSAIPFLSAPAAYLAATAEPPQVPPRLHKGCMEIDGQKFTYEGLAVDECGLVGRADFLPELPAQEEWTALWAGRELLMDSMGEWLVEDGEEDVEGDVDVETLSDVVVDVDGTVDCDDQDDFAALRLPPLPPFYLSDNGGESRLNGERFL